MATGTIKSITENGIELIFVVTVSGADYVAIVPKIIFDALPTNLEKQNYIISIISDMRRKNRLYEVIYPAIVGTIINIID